MLGFAFALIATPLISLAVSKESAILLTLIPTVWANLFTIYITYKLNLQSFLLKKYFLLYLSIVVGVMVGTHLLFIIDTNMFNLFLLLSIWFYLYMDFIKSNFTNEKIVFLDKTFSTVALGLLAGISAGIANIMSPILLIYLLAKKIKKDEMILVSNISFLLAKIVQLIIFIDKKTISSNYYLLTVIILIISTIGLFFGKKLSLSSFIVKHYYRLVKIFIFILSLLILGKILHNF